MGSTGTKSSGTGIPVEQIPGMAQAKVSPHPGAVALNRCRSGHRFRSGHRGRDGRSDGRSGSLEAHKRWVWSCARSYPTKQIANPTNAMCIGRDTQYMSCVLNFLGDSFHFVNSFLFSLPTAFLGTSVVEHFCVSVLVA